MKPYDPESSETVTVGKGTEIKPEEQECAVIAWGQGKRRSFVYRVMK